MKLRKILIFWWMETLGILRFDIPTDTCHYFVLVKWVLTSFFSLSLSSCSTIVHWGYFLIECTAITHILYSYLICLKTMFTLKHWLFHNLLQNKSRTLLLLICDWNRLFYYSWNRKKIGNPCLALKGKYGNITNVFITFNFLLRSSFLSSFFSF